MKIFRNTFLIAIMIFGYTGMLISGLLISIWNYFIVLLLLLKFLTYTGILHSVYLLNMPYFGGIFTISAIGTGLWLLLFGLIGIFLSYMISAAAIVLLDN